MRPDVLVGPSEWVVEQFGDKVAGELWTRVPEALSTAIEMAFVGPLMSCFDESSSAPTAVITMAVYRPYCGGIPAIWA